MAATSLCLLLVAHIAHAQDQGETPPAFRSGVTRVELSAIVVDADGQPVRDLRADEVQLFERGRPQEVLSFAPVQLAVDPDAAVEAPGAASVRATNGDPSTSRVVALLIDDLHLDARRTAPARALALQVLEQLRPADLLYVGLTSDASRSTGMFTTARLRARHLIDDFSGLRLPSTAQERRDTPDLPMTPPPQMRGTEMGLAVDTQQHAVHLAQTFSVIGALARGLEDAPGQRKTLVLLTEGPAAAVQEHQGAGPAAADAMREALARAARADLAIYPLSPAGLDTPTDGMIEGFTRSVDATGREVAHEDLSAAIADALSGKALLRDVAALTGGRPLIDRNDAPQAIAEALQEASTYYVLSYEPDREAGAGLVPVEVRVSRPGVRVRTRRGRAGMPRGTATASADATATNAADTTAGLAQVLRGLGVGDALPVTLQAFRLTDADQGPRYAIAAEIAGPPLVAARDGDRLAIAQALVTVDPTGRMSPATSRSFDVRVPDTQAPALQASGLRSVWVVDLPPGLHQVRLATLQPSRGLHGLAAVDLEVVPSAPSDLDALAAEMADARPTAFVDSRLEALLPSAPSSPREALPAPDDTVASLWATAMTAYQRGDYGNAATLAVAAEPDTLKDVIANEVARVRQDSDQQDALRRLKVSAALSLEQALLHVQTGDATKSAQYLRLAQDARDAISRSRAPSPSFTAHWDLARLHILLLTSEFTNVTRTGASVPGDGLTPEARAEWYVARGLAREAQSRQALWDRPTRTQVQALAPTHFERELWIANERQAAIAEYRRALGEAPSHLEAQVRLGRLLFEQGRLDEARPHLTTAASRDCTTVLCGLAWLFLGDWHAKTAAVDDARAAYLQASRVLDVRQSALVALLRLTLETSPASAATLARQFDATSMLGRQQTPDAWSSYLASSPLGLPNVLIALRDEARQ